MLDKNMKYAIGVDLGATKIEIGVVGEDGRIHNQKRIDTNAEAGPEEVEKKILSEIKDVIRNEKISILGIGIGVAGQVDPENGIVIFAPNLKWTHFPLKSRVEKALNIPTCVINDVRAITLAEWRYGAGKECDDLLCVFIGTGIGSGVVNGGKLLNGSSNTYGEVGHMTINLNGPLCTCGKQGCFEIYAGGWGIAMQAIEAIKKDQSQKLSQYLISAVGGVVEDITAKIVIDAYRKKDPLAENVMIDVQKALIAGLSSLVNLYNPKRLILGGGIIEGIPNVIDMIDSGIRKNALKAATQSLQVVKSQLGKEVGVIGSAAAVFLRGAT